MNALLVVAVLFAVSLTNGCAEVTDTSTTTTTSVTSSSSSSTTTTTVPDPTPPTNVTLSINSSATTTETRTVTAEIHAEDNIGITKYYLTEEATAPSVSSGVWTSVTATTEYTNSSATYTLSSGGGTTKEVYLFVADAAGNIGSAEASIFLTFYRVDWGKTYAGISDGSEGLDIATGSVFICGETNSSPANMLVVKYSNSGAQEWTETYDYNGENDEARGIATDSSGNIYVTGRGRKSGNWNCLTLKYDSGSNLLWVATFEGANSDAGEGVAVDASGNVYVAGASTNVDPDYLTIKYDSTGNQVWLATYESSGGDDNGADVALDSSGNVYVTGTRNKAANNDIVTIKYDSNGTQLWIATYESGNDDYGRSIAVDSSGNVFVTGFQDTGGSNFDFVTVKYDTNGTQQWAATYDGGAADHGYGNTVDSAGNVYVIGSTERTTDDYLTIKYDSSGNEIWRAYYDSSGTVYGATVFGEDPNDDFGFAVAIDSSNNVCVTGFYTPDGTDFDAVTIKYIQN